MNINLIGQRLGQYEILSVLGKGGMATVYRARQESVKREVAVKVIKPDLAETDDFIKRFEREAQTVASLSHPHILKVFDYGEQDSLVYLVMELLTGGSLAALIGKSTLSPSKISGVLDQITSALTYAHQRSIVHRDLKPQNVLMDDGGNAFLTDFGIAKMLQSTTGLTGTGVAMGTPSYMAPEQWRGGNVDARTDIYALGVMTFEMLSGALPYTGDTPYTLMHMHVYEPLPSVLKIKPNLPNQVDQVLAKALAKDPDQRFTSATEMAVAFKKALEGVPVSIVHDEDYEPTLVGEIPVLAQSSASKQATPTSIPTSAPTPPVETGLRNARSIPMWYGLAALGILVILVVGILILLNQSTHTSTLAGNTTQTSVAVIATQSQNATITSMPTTALTSTSIVATTPVATTPTALTTSAATLTATIGNTEQTNPNSLKALEPTDTPTKPIPTNILDLTPVFHPLDGISGKLLVVQDYSLKLLDADKGTVSQVTPPYSGDVNGSFSPDGQALALTRVNDKGVFVYIGKADGSNLHLLIEQGAKEASWSPDGKHLVLTVTENGDSAIASVNVDGTSLKLLTKLGLNQSPTWSPDGKQIVYTAPGSGRLVLWIMNADGSDNHQLTDNHCGDASDPTWSPNSQEIVFVSCDDKSDSKDAPNGVWIMNRDGSGLRVLAQDATSNMKNPVWSPDGTHIAYVKFHGSEIRGTLIVANADGTTPQPLYTQLPTASLGKTVSWSR